MVITVGPTGRDYTSLSAAEAGEQADLVTLNDFKRFDCYAFQDTTAVTFDGWTTDAMRYIEINVPASDRHNGAWDASAYRLVAGPDGAVLNVAEDYVTVRGIQIHNTRTTGNPTGIVVFGSSGTFVVTQSIVRGASSTGRSYGYNIRCALAHVRNCVAYDWIGESGSTGFRQNVVTNGMFTYNCTAYNCAVGFQQPDNGTNHIVKNCLAASCTVAFQAGWAWPAACDYNATDLARANTGNGALNDPPGATVRVSQTFSFVDAANGDFHLTGSDGGARDFGTDLSADADQPFSDDIDGQTRSGTWDIGADEYQAAGGLSATVNQVTETDTAQAITSRKQKGIAQATETDSAQPIAVRKSRTIGQAVETDSAQALAHTKAKGIAQAAETDQAQAITARKTLLIGQTTETDLAQAVTRSTPGSIIVPVGQAAETDQAQPLSVNPQRRLISQASEANQAQPLTIRKLKSLGIAIETDLAQALSRHKLKTLDQALETDLAQAVSWNPMRRLIGQALELDEALAVSVVHGEQIPVLILPAITRVYRIDARARLFVLRVKK